jgi:hypothetical protein
LGKEGGSYVTPRALGTVERARHVEVTEASRREQEIAERARRHRESEVSRRE